MLDHIRKLDARGKRAELTLDDVKGSGAKVQNADTIILMDRTPDQSAIKFQCFPKDWDSPIRILLGVAPKGSTLPKFTYAGDLDALGERSSEAAQLRRDQAWSRLPETQWLSSSDIAQLIGSNARTAQRYVNEWVKLGLMDASPGSRRDRRYCRVSANNVSANVS